MIFRLITTFLLIIVFVGASNAQCAVGFGTYFTEQARFGQEDWIEIKNEFNKVIIHRNNIEFGREEWYNAIYLCSRVASIEWRVSQVQEIEIFMSYFFEENLRRLSSLHKRINPNKADFSENYHELSWYIFRTTQEIGGNISCNALKNGLNYDKFLGGKTAKSISRVTSALYFKDNKWCNCILDLEQKYFRGQKEIEESIEEIRYKNKVANLSQEKGFKYIYKKLKKEGAFTYPVNDVSISKWATELSLMIKIHRDMNIASLYNTYKDADNFIEKYFWAYCFTLSINNKLSRKIPFSKEEQSELFDILDSFRSTYQKNFDNNSLLQYDKVSDVYSKIKNRIK